MTNSRSEKEIRAQLEEQAGKRFARMLASELVSFKNDLLKKHQEALKKENISAGEDPELIRKQQQEDLNVLEEIIKKATENEMVIKEGQRRKAADKAARDKVVHDAQMRAQKRTENVEAMGGIDEKLRADLQTRQFRDAEIRGDRRDKELGHLRIIEEIKKDIGISGQEYKELYDHLHVLDLKKESTHGNKKLESIIERIVSHSPQITKLEQDMRLAIQKLKDKIPITTLDSLDTTANFSTSAYRKATDKVRELQSALDDSSKYQELISQLTEAEATLQRQLAKQNPSEIVKSDIQRLRGEIEDINGQINEMQQPLIEARREQTRAYMLWQRDLEKYIEATPVVQNKMDKLRNNVESLKQQITTEKERIHNQANRLVENLVQDFRRLSAANADAKRSEAEASHPSPKTPEAGQVAARPLPRGTSVHARVAVALSGNTGAAEVNLRNAQQKRRVEEAEAKVKAKVQSQSSTPKKPAPLPQDASPIASAGEQIARSDHRHRTPGKG